MTKDDKIVIGISIDLMTVNEGDVIRLKDGRDGVVTENMHDGQWLEMDFDGEIDLIHGQDMTGFVKRVAD
ncbi:MAG: hypothetical protein KUG69_09320 [Marinosulfonomonas sp.]|nr:hypothetical protein [Marinosulfonomonas sp.]